MNATVLRSWTSAASQTKTQQYTQYNMSHILFPVEESRLNPSNSRYKPTEIPRQLFYIIRATTDAIDALELFLGLIFEPCCLDDKKRPIGFLAFDAHVGDTACQLRACMLLELTKHFRRPRSSTYAIAIRCIISDLKRVLEDSHQLLGALLDLDWNKIRSGGLDALGMPKTGMTMNELLLKLGWTGINIPLFGYNSHSASSQESLASITSDRFGTMSTGSLDSLRPETADDLYGELCEPPELGHVVRFLVYCYVLSNYKQLVATNEVYRATLKPEHAIKVAQNLVKREIGKQFVRPNKRAIEEEFLVLQRHISDWSCTWLESRARRLRTIQPQLHSLLKSSFRKSNKGIRSASSYAGYLVLRSLWAESSTPIIIMTTRFCPSGASLKSHRPLPTNFDSRIPHELLQSSSEGASLRPRVSRTPPPGKGFVGSHTNHRPGALVSPSIHGATYLRWYKQPRW